MATMTPADRYYPFLLGMGLILSPRFSRRAVPLAGLVLLTGGLIGIILEEKHTFRLLSFYSVFLLISWFLSLTVAKYKMKRKEVNR